jgi:Icc-related predicted phosphoesterase
MWRVPLSIPFLVALLALCPAACRDPGEPPAGEQPGGPFLRCAPPVDDGARESFRLEPLQLVRDGHDLDVRGIERGTVVLGLLSGIHEPHPRNLANLGFFLDRFRAAGVQLIAVAGGVGLQEPEVAGVLEALARAPVPVLVSPGAQESLDVLRGAIDKARARAPQLIDMTRVRRVRIGHVTLISLPGYHNAFYLEAGGRGCAYEAGDLDDVARLAEAKRANVLLSASPPRGRGPQAVDLGRGGVNIGDPALARMLGRAGIPFGLFGHVHEAGGSATAADGATPIAAGIWHESLFLQAGAAEALTLGLASGGTVAGLAHVVEFSGARARYRPVPAEPASR